MDLGCQAQVREENAIQATITSSQENLGKNDVRGQ